MDVVVIGAGLAGLVAAGDLLAGGASVVVLEARDRVGGRLLSVGTGRGVTIDLGGQWVGPEHDRLRALVQRLRLGLTRAPAGGRVTARIDGRPVAMPGLVPAVGPVARIDLLQAGVRLARMVRACSLEQPASAPRMARRDEVTVARWLGRSMFTATGRAVARAMVESSFAYTAEETSLLGLLFDIRAAESLEGVLGAQAEFVAGGAQQLAAELAVSLGARVRTRREVARVSQTATRVEVAAGRERWRARAAAVCIPPALAQRIAFEPALPVERRALVEGMLPGNAVKVVALYDEPFWREDGHSGQTLNVGFPLSLTGDVSPDPSVGVLLALACGTGADRLRELPRPRREPAVLGWLAELFGPGAKAASEVHIHDWSDEPWTGGCYAAHFTPGTLRRAGAALAEPSGRIHWGGTETATGWHGYMEGAVRSGERVAAEVLRAIGAEAR